MSSINSTINLECPDYLKKIDSVKTLINQYRENSEKQRKTPRIIIDKLIELGIHRMWVSNHFGGSQVSIKTGMAIIESLALLDASVAWQMGVQGALSRLSDYLSEDIAKMLFKDHSRLIVGVIAPSGKAERILGGFILNGRWSFASGSAHADWLACAAVITEKGLEVRNENNSMVQILFVPCKDYKIIDDWYTTGLRGTSSNSFEVNNIFVPDEYTVAGSMLFYPPPKRASRAFTIGYNDFGPFTSVPTTLGIAHDALDSLLEMAATKVPLGGKMILNKSHTVQEKIGKAYSLLLSSRLLIENAANCALDKNINHDSLSALIRLSASTIAINTKNIVDIAHTLSGASSVYEGNRIEHCFRDINTAIKHITLSPNNIEMVGQFLMGGGLYPRR